MSEFVENSRDCFVTPEWVLKIVEYTFGGPIKLDPYWDPHSLVAPLLEHYNIRDGQDGNTLPWMDGTFANPPYGADGPELAARAMNRSFEDGIRETMLLVPASIGSVYWGKYIWPMVPTVGFLGRVSFIAGRDMAAPETGGRAIRRGQVVRGNRHEIALIYAGDHVSRFVEALSSVPAELIGKNTRAFEAVRPVRLPS